MLTTMAGDPPNPLPDTPIIADLHQRWQAGYDARRQEDLRALARLGAQAVHWPIGDCVYRTVFRDGQNVALYPTEESLWAGIPTDDPALHELRQRPLPEANTVYIPLGVGHHVDHRIVRDWGLTLKNPNRIFYEEYPYINAKMEVDRALSSFSPRTMQLKVQPVDDNNIAAKVQAIACYESQISTFWSDVADMETQTRRSMLEAGDGTPAERFWTIVK